MKSKTLEASEAVSQSYLNRAVDTESKFLAPAADGKIHIKLLKVSSEYVAIAPIARERQGIIVTPNADTNIGLIVGWGVMVPERCQSEFPIGAAVRFSGTPVAELTGEFSFYGSAQILLLRYTSVLAAVSPVEVAIEA